MKRLIFTTLSLLPALTGIIAAQSIKPATQPAPLQPINSVTRPVPPQPIAPIARPTLPPVAPQPPQPQRARIEIDLSDRTLTLFQAGDKQVFPVAVGSAATPTPVGNFQVLQMQVNPIYENPFTGKVYRGGADSPIGIRWIAFEKTRVNGGEAWYGIHGTNQPRSIGQAISTGCIRMNADDLVWVYGAIALGSEIVVQE